MPLELNNRNKSLVLHNGLDYGISNKGKTARKELVNSRIAEAHGCTTLDTAASYGDSEEIIGCVAQKHFPL